VIDELNEEVAELAGTEVSALVLERREVREVEVVMEGEAEEVTALLIANCGVKFTLVVSFSSVSSIL